MYVYIFARFHAKPGCEGDVEKALLKVIAPSRQEPGCLSIHAYSSLRDPRLFFIHSRWQDEAAFNAHTALAHTVDFVEEVSPLLDHLLEPVRTRLVG